MAVHTLILGVILDIMNRNTSNREENIKIRTLWVSGIYVQQSLAKIEEAESEFCKLKKDLTQNRKLPVKGSKPKIDDRMK